ncbi:MAG: CvpA family protein [Candidatus Magasanikbacteria bacterium]|jgi:uncharacterized membrane protein required for colicin V production|nr:CvpA family protein [Candidatus Magasanikbacteria bacterium]
MELIDIILLIVIGGFSLFGVWFGFFHTLGSFFGTVFGVFIASRFFEPAAQWLMNITGWEGNLSRVLVFSLAFIVINRFIGFLFWVVDNMLSVITRLPFIKGLNHIFGLALGTFEGLITVGFVVYFLELFPVSGTISVALHGSWVALLCLNMTQALIPLLPQALQLVEHGVEQGIQAGVTGADKFIEMQL